MNLRTAVQSHQMIFYFCPDNLDLSIASLLSVKFEKRLEEKFKTKIADFFYPIPL